MRNREGELNRQDAKIAKVGKRGRKNDVRIELSKNIQLSFSISFIRPLPLFPTLAILGVLAVQSLAYLFQICEELHEVPEAAALLSFL